MATLRELQELERDREREIERIDAGGDAWEGTTPVEDEVEVRKPLDKIIPVRLSDEHWKQLHAEARELGVGPTTLMRMWVLEKLRSLRQTRQSA